jgi:hypothetical protein
MPITLPDRKNGPRRRNGPRPGLVPDILDGLAVAFCIVMFTWAAQHVVFDYLANPNRSAIFSSTNTSGQISIITVPPPERM